MLPVVSIVLPTFNRLEFLPATIDSVLAQTFSQWELIIADDGSADEAKRYLQSLRDPRIKVIWLQHTGKPSVVTNAAIRAASGKYIAFLDSDDLWLPHKLAAQIGSLSRHCSRHWSYTRFALIDAAGRALPSTRDRDRPAPAGWILGKILDSQAVVAQPSVIVDRSLLEQIGAFDEDLTMCYDDDLWLRLAAKCEIDSVDEPLTLIRRHAQHSGSDALAWSDRRRVFEKALRRNENGRHQAALRKLRAQMSVGLAKSHARYGKRLDGLVALFACMPHCWRFPNAWLGGAAVVASRFAPRSVRALIVARRD